MSDEERNEAAELAKKQLTDACRTKDRSVRLAWAITIGEAILLAVIAIALADYWLMLPIWMRSAGAAMIGAFGALGLYRLFKYFRRPTPLKEAALDLEAAQPTLGCEVSTAAEYLSGERKVTHEYEPQLVAALETKAAEQLRSSHVPYGRRLLRPAIILAITVAGFIIFVFSAPAAFTALTRALLPFSKAQYTQVEVTPGTVDVPIGQDLEITCNFTGRPPEDPQFFWQEQGDSKWQTSALTMRSSSGAFLFVFKDLQESLNYRVGANDALSETFQINTYAPPEVKDVAIEIQYPAYTGLKPTTQSTAELTGLRGSRVEIRVAPTVPLSRARLRFSTSEEEITLQPAVGGWWMASFSLAKDTEYWFELADEKGREGKNDKRHQIKVLPDRPPNVEIQSPGQDSSASATNKIPVRISVSDDYGVEQIELVFHKMGGAEHAIVATVESDDKGEKIATAELDLSTLNLSEFELVAYHAQAKDNNNIDGPGIGKSPIYFIEITNLDSSEAQGQPAGPSVNLLVIQKQVIADTTALPDDSSAEKFSELALRQRDARDFAQIYLETLAAAPPAAVMEMQSAVEAMQKSTELLEARDRTRALPREESALAHLYQVLKLMPELETMPVIPMTNQPPATNKLAVALAAIQARRKEAPASTNEVERALQQAQQLAEAQAALNAAFRKAQQPESNKADQKKNPAMVQAKAEAQGQGQGEGEGQGQGKGQGKGKGKGQKQREGKGEPTQAQEEQKQETNSQSAPQEKEDPALAAEERKESNASDTAQDENQEKPPQPTKDAQLTKADHPGAKPQDAGKPAASQAQGKSKGKTTAKAKALAKAKATAKAKGGGSAKGESPKVQAPQDHTPEPSLEPEMDPLEELNPEDLAQKEVELSKEAAELAQMLNRLAGNNKRIGHNAGQKARQAGQKIAEASEEVKKGNFGAAGVHGFSGELALREVVTELQAVVRPKPALTDVTSEEAPKAYEPLISEYFKKLSHAQ